MAHAFKLYFYQHRWQISTSKESVLQRQSALAASTLDPCLQVLGIARSCKLHLQVYANDLNPRSVFYLRENMKLNKVRSPSLSRPWEGRAELHFSAADHQ